MTNCRYYVRCLLATLAVCVAAFGSQTKKQPAPTNPLPHSPFSAQQIFKRVSTSVMVVESLNAEGKVAVLGSGVVVAPGRVITNRHVIEDGVGFLVVHNEKKWPAKLIKVDPDHDLAELSVAGLNAPAVTVLDSSKLAVGEAVYAIGSPEGLELTISEGLISGLREFDKGRVIQTSAAISPGSSGGGLFDDRGRLVGITTFQLKEGQSLNFALPAEWTLALNHRPPNAAATTNESSGEFQALTWVEAGLAHFQAGEYAPAVRDFREAIRLKADYEVAWANLGGAYHYLGQDEEAVSAEQEALRIEPNDGVALSNIGVIYVGLHRYDDAIKALREAIRLKPDNGMAWMMLGDAYVAIGQYNSAVYPEQQATRVSPSDGVAWRALAEAYIWAGHPDKALGPAEEATRLTPNESKAWYALGIAYNANGRRQEAIKVYDKLKTLDPAMASDLSNAIGLP